MEKIRKLNLEVALFVKEIDSYIKNADSKINDETIKLLIETIENVNKLQKISKFHEKSSTNESSFINNLSDDVFKCRRYIVCCLCHEQFPLTSEDFCTHSSKQGHKEKETEIHLLHNNGLVSHSIQKNPCVPTIPENNTNSTNSTNDGQNYILQSDSSDSSVFNNDGLDDKSVTKSVEIPKHQSIAENFTNVINTEEISRNIVDKAINFMFRSVQRISIEVQILNLLLHHLKGFDSSLQIVPFGSATYGFGGSSTDFNILVIAETAVNKNLHEAQHLFEQFIKTSGFQRDFQMLDTIHGDRVQNRRLQALHKSSGILCRIHFDLKSESAKSSQIIRNCILHSPLCYHLIAYIKSWQNALNDSAATNGLCAFQFNTYIISVLVVFFLQMNNQFPKIADVPATDTKFIDYVPQLEKEKFKRAVIQFFKFYASQYQIKNHIIGVNFGRWKNRIMEGKQTNHTPEEEKLKAAIELNPHNWENCTMYVQDLISPEINIVAEISKEEANNFKHMCKVFATVDSHDQPIDEYFAKISDEMSTCLTITLDSGAHLPKNPASELGETLIPNPKFIDANQKFLAMGSPKIDSIFSNNAIANLKSAAIKKLKDVDMITKHIKIEMSEMLSRSKSRINSEQGIIKMLTFFVLTYDASIKLTPFGSVTYGFGGSSTNFNILISSDTTTSGEFQIIMENLLKTSDLFKNEFKLLNHVKPNRVQSEQLIIRHIKSGIQCILQIATEPVLLYAEQTKKIILDYLSLDPLCIQLIAYIKAWRNILNKESSKHGLMVFHMNTYIITVLVIFYLQMNHKLPKVKDLNSVISNKLDFSIKSDLSQLIKGFFEFYGKSFNYNTHIISIHVGRWQQQVQKKQKHLTDEQKSMRKGIKACPKNWENCTMCVQDIISSHINITAEISKQEVDNFVRLCQTFAKHEPKFDDGSHSVTKTIAKPISNQPNTLFSLTSDSIKNTNLIELLEKEISKFCSPSTMELRQRFEWEIFSTMESFLHEFDPSLKLCAFGSSQYGIKLPGSNYNLMVVTTLQIKTLKIATQLFLSKFAQSSISRNFNGLSKITANRVMNSQISMIHIKSGIKCIVTFETDQAIIESTKIIACFIKDPLCHILISFLRLLLDALHRSSGSNFEFNTYTISILVIFFLQVDYKYPTVEQIVSQSRMNISKISEFEKARKRFFTFYGKRYQIGNHVISANIGQWQERHSQPEQKLFGAKKRLRIGIKTSPINWTNCTMYVQDLVRPNINVTAGISKKAAENFQLICESFAKTKF